MATSFPRRPVFANGPGGAAERLVWQLACAQLPPEVTVYPNLALRRRRPRGTAGRPPPPEHDLLVVDPDNGVTVVEVVGGGVRVDAAGRWTRPSTGAPLERAPGILAERTVAELRTVLAEADPALDRLPVRWAVALPDAEVDGRGGGGVPPEAVWDRGAAVGTGAFINAYHALWSLQPVGTSRDEVAPSDWALNHLHRRLVARSVAGVSYLADRLRDDEDRLRQLVPSRLLRAALQTAGHGSCLVTGGPGTGKTTVALELCVAAAARGERVLLTGFRRALGAWQRHRLTDLLVADGLLQQAVRVTPDAAGSIVVGEVNELSGAEPAAEEDPERFWVERAPDWVSSRRFGGRFDLVVVDEWHALPPSYRSPLHSLVAPGGRFVALGDPHQAPRVDDLVPDAFDAHVRLAVAERSPADLARLAAALVGAAPPATVRPSTLATWLPASAAALDGVARAAAEDVVESGAVAPGDVAILTLAGDDGPASAGHAAGDRLSEALRAGGLVTSSVRAFAGLERDVVVLVLDVDRLDPRTPGDELRRLAALGVSRARRDLVVVGDPAQVRLHGLGVLADHLRTPRPEPLGSA